MSDYETHSKPADSKPDLTQVEYDSAAKPLLWLLLPFIALIVYAILA